MKFSNGLIMEIAIWSDAFYTGGTIPSKHTCDGIDISPPLSWKGIHSDTKSITLIMEDPDAPGKVFVHWVIFNIPPFISTLPEGIPKIKNIDFTIQGINDFGRIGYNGPCPPVGKPHRYFFKIYALNIRLNLPPGSTKAEVEKAMDNHLLNKGELMGRYGR